MMMESFRGEVHAGSTRASAHHAGYVKQAVVGQARGAVAGAEGFGGGDSRNVRRGCLVVLLLEAAFFFFDHLLCSADERLHFAGLAGAGPEVVAMVTLARVAGGPTPIG